MSSYQAMGVPPSASSFAQFYHQAAASAVSAASAVGGGIDTLGKYIHKYEFVSSSCFRYAYHLPSSIIISIRSFFDLCSLFDSSRKCIT